MQFQPDSSGHAGSALRTTGEPRRGRCKTSTGAECSVFFRALGQAASRLAAVMSSSPAPHRFAHQAAPLSAGRPSKVQAPTFASGSAQVSAPARPSSAHAPGRSSAGFLSVLVEPSAFVASMNAFTAARVAAGDSPVGPIHALQQSSPSVVSRSKGRGPLHNPGLQLTRFASLARS